MAKCPTRLQKIVSGSHDGEIRIWDVAERKSLISIYDHQHSVKGVTFSRDGNKFLSSSDDKIINLYDFQQAFEKSS
jgi:WD repeat and SOF domain-containing protein 1